MVSGGRSTVRATSSLRLIWSGANSSEAESDNMGLEQTMMSVLGIREVRRVEAPIAVIQRPDVAAELAPKIGAILAEYLVPKGIFVHVCVLDERGLPVAEATLPEHGAGDLARLQAAMRGLARTYPRLGLARTFIQDGVGTVAAIMLPRDLLLLAVAGKAAVLGPVSMTTAKLTARLAELLGPSANEPAAGATT
jgi:hypothetical protein